MRQVVTRTEIDASRSHQAKFVGLDAYEAAGGYVRKDLFSDARTPVILPIRTCCIAWPPTG
jgi:hypothetical protein